VRGGIDPALKSGGTADAGTPICSQAVRESSPMKIDLHKTGSGWRASNAILHETQKSALLAPALPTGVGAGKSRTACQRHLTARNTASRKRARLRNFAWPEMLDDRT